MKAQTLVRFALFTALTAHGEQRRKGKDGETYIFHPVRVYEAVKRVRPLDYELQAAALLHDVVEDTDLSFGYLTMLGFPDRTVEIVRFLTHLEGETYFEYIDRVAQSDSARLIKLADIDDNLIAIPPEMAGIEKRYHKARARLLGEG